MQTVTVQTTQNIDIDYEVAGLGDRILARLIDIGFYVALAIVLLVIAAASSWSKPMLITLAIIYFIVFAFYDLVCEIFFNGQCFGKRIMKIKVISLNGGRPSISQYILRWLFRIVDFSLTSGVCALITVAVSDKNQRVGDIVAGTTLIKTTPRSTLQSIVFMPAVEQYAPVFNNASQLTDNDIVLINEVLENYRKTGNSVLTYNMATRIKQLLGVELPNGMDDHQFLETIKRDYNYLTSSVEKYTPVFNSVTQLTDNDITLIHEVLTNYRNTGNRQLVLNMAERIKQHLTITPPEGMNDLVFLQTIVKDYSYLTAEMNA